MAQKSEFLPLRLSPEEKSRIEFLAKDYNMGSVSEFIRAVMKYIDSERPTLTVIMVPEGKVLALTASLN